MKFLFLFLMVLSGQALCAQSRVAVRITKFENNKGVCIVCLYNNAKAFAGKGEPVSCTTVGIADKIATASFDNVPVGTYAVSVIHDANANKKFDTNFLGIPKEGYGASQNKLPFAAAPKFDDNKFSVVAGSVTTANIQLRYIF